MDWKTFRLALAWLGYWVAVAAVAALLAATTGNAPSGPDRRSALEAPHGSGVRPRPVQTAHGLNGAGQQGR